MSDPTPTKITNTKTIRILSLDGGGMRGVIQAHWLNLFCEKAQINGNELWRYFDVITGTSIGGISALAYANRMTPLFVKQLLMNNGPNIFNAYGLKQAGTIAWSAYLTGQAKSLYDNAPLKQILSDNFSTLRLDDLKTNVLVPSVKTLDYNNQDANYPVYFSNISNQAIKFLTNGLSLVDVALATSAAPVYFPPYVIAGAGTFVDGGVVLNNPVAMALACAKAMKPLANRCCVLSIGTGLGSIGNIPDQGTTVPATVSTSSSWYSTLTSWLSSSSPVFNFISHLSNAAENISRIKQVLNQALTIPPEGVAKEMETLSSLTLDQLYYYRMQYKLDAIASDSSLDNASSDFIAAMQTSAEQQFNEDFLNIHNFIGHFSVGLSAELKQGSTP